MKTKYMVFDVESIGLHGEGFAVGFVVIDEEGNFLERTRFACSPNQATGDEEGFAWAREHMPKFDYTHDAPWLVRAAFWRRWREWQPNGAVLVADCAWPVEARFLARCVEDNPSTRKWEGPYPLHDLASILLALGKDPLTRFERRLEDERPEHDPLADATQSARVLWEALHTLRQRNAEPVPASQ